MSDTGRWALPLLDAGQAQKEMTHNEALATLDLLAHPSVAAVAVNTPPADPAAGQCWIVGSAPTGAWAGRAGTLAGWTAGGWRFVQPREGLQAWSIVDGVPATYVTGQWRLGRIAASELVIGGMPVVGGRRPAIAAPAGGAAPDLEARAALTQIIATLVAHGLIAA
jgi:hypothetical protein